MAATGMLTALVALFKLDRDIHTLQTGLESVQREQRTQEARIAELTKALDAVESVTKKTQADQGVRELELKTRQQHIEKMRTSLNTTKTNKEYSAILVQISAEKAEVSTIEGGVLELMQQVETNQKQIEELRKQIEQEQGVLARIHAEHGEKVASLERQIEALKGRRVGLASAVPPDALRQYDRISQKYPGDALAPIEYDENDLDTVSCGSCYMGLNVEHLNALRGRDEVRRCNSCNRILYLAELMVEQPAAHH